MTTSNDTMVMPYYLQAYIQELAKPIGIRLDWKNGTPHGLCLKRCIKTIDSMYLHSIKCSTSLRKQFSKKR